MDFKEFSKKFIEKIGGEYNDYDDNHSIFIIPLKDDRFQTVVAKLVHHQSYGRDSIQVTSKVCSTGEQIDYPKVLEASKDFSFTNFIVKDDFLQVDTSIFLDKKPDLKLIEGMIMEVAYTADEWENNITGKDVY